MRKKPREVVSTIDIWEIIKPYFEHSLEYILTAEVNISHCAYGYIECKYNPPGDASLEQKKTVLDWPKSLELFLKLSEVVELPKLEIIRHIWINLDQRSSLPLINVLLQTYKVVGEE